MLMFVFLLHLTPSSAVPPAVPPEAGTVDSWRLRVYAPRRVVGASASEVWIGLQNRADRPRVVRFSMGQWQMRGEGAQCQKESALSPGDPYALGTGEQHLILAHETLYFGRASLACPAGARARAWADVLLDWSEADERAQDTRHIGLQLWYPVILR